MAYAKETSAPVSKTEGEIKAVIRKYGATSFASFESGTAAMIAFEMRGRRVMLKLPLPDRTANEFTETPTGRWARSDQQAERAWEQACRARWRAFYLCVKAKLESVEAGIETFEDAFLAHIQMPDGMTVAEHVKPRIASAYETGNMQPLLPAPKGAN
ncbi:hypothetical protein C5748_18120 [Phyllobacterium phragmitis]|uniref:Uncharacterized protein n=1 Tax=Phyllobacterium phragmitis TaxID=2670329 RepID=A0A2S9INH3_9HYPH|nr:hypothetical protein [Phyllobacterium phragmitis]PRD42074.1 hypothetical protein C5748_18120 [Phyllobacterium phragmitis]